MDIDKVEMSDSLIEWFKVLNLRAPHANVSQLSDGEALAQALNQIAPETFKDSWLQKIKSDVGTNWRLKVSNLKKVVEGVYDYYTDILNLSLSEFSRPDVMKIAEEEDSVELGRLLQLILGCAVNCSDKQNYITQIMELEESLQRNIMRALQDLESVWQGASPSRNSLSIANFDLKILQEERDALTQKCFEAEKQIALLLEDKTSLQQEINKLQEQLTKGEHLSAIGEDGVSIGPVQIGSNRYNDLRRQMEALKEELMQAETSREDLKIKSLQQEKEITSLHAKIDEMTHNASELSQLKDELDILREANDKLKVYESQLTVYKKKLEDHNDLKKQVKLLEERSAEYLRQNALFEDDNKKLSAMKGEIELYKKGVQDLNIKLDNEMSKNVKLEFESKNYEGKLSTLQREKDNLLQERDVLRETIDELRCNQTSEPNNTVSRELLSPALKEKIERLEIENKALREGQGGKTALTQLLDDANKRIENLRNQLKSADERILSLTQIANTNDPSLRGAELTKQLKQIIELNEQKAVQIDEAHTQIATLQAKLGQTENALVNKEQECAKLEARYRKCLEKAKEVIKTIDSRIAGEANLLDKNAENECERSKMTSKEEKLIATAFYRFGLTSQRDAVDAKLALLSGQGQSFLARQRQSVPRKSLNMNFKQK